MPVSYEWDAETVSDDGYEDVLDHSHWAKASEALRYIDNSNESNQRLVLVRDVYREHEGLVDRSWAYIEDGKLPERFADAYGNEDALVPKRYHAELDRALASR